MGKIIGRFESLPMETQLFLVELVFWAVIAYVWFGGRGT